MVWTNPIQTLPDSSTTWPVTLFAACLASWRRWPSMNRGLTWFANLWLGMAIVVNALVVAEAFASSTSFWTGLSQLRQVYNPFDMQNILFQVILFSPVVVALLWRNRRQERSTH
jgi:hypothetical protein